jgi:hypothetical protein
MADADPIQPPVIWLSPFCEGCAKHCGSSPEEGQLWCVHPQDDCPECGLRWTRYVLDEEQAAEARNEPDR